MSDDLAGKLVLFQLSVVNRTCEWNQKCYPFISVKLSIGDIMATGMRCIHHDKIRKYRLKLAESTSNIR
jgi:hypothetical protein